VVVQPISETMIASTASFVRPLAVKQATLQPTKQRTAVMNASLKHIEAPAIDRRRCVADFVVHLKFDIKNVPQHPELLYKLIQRYSICTFVSAAWFLS